jgi:hypothetical protein
MKLSMPVFPRVSKIPFIALCFLPVLVLTACDDSWDIKPYYETPYTYDRTAGHGVEWIRTHMMHEKSINAEPLIQSEYPHKNPVRVTTRP